MISYTISYVVLPTLTNDIVCRTYDIVYNIIRTISDYESNFESLYSWKDTLSRAWDTILKYPRISESKFETKFPFHQNDTQIQVTNLNLNYPQAQADLDPSNFKLKRYIRVQYVLCVTVGNHMIYRIFATFHRFFRHSGFLRLFSPFSAPISSERRRTDHATLGIMACRPCAARWPLKDWTTANLHLGASDGPNLKLGRAQDL